jgi:hypothetical protein
MKEQPILFSTEMVKAILEGRKTQTRRVVVAQTGEWKGKQPIDVLPMKIPNEWVGLMQHDPNRGQVFKCRYGQPGDRLWCKSTHMLLDESLIPNVDILYRLTDDRLYAILMSMEVQDGRYKTDEWSPSQSYPNLPQRGLHGGFGWSSLLTNKIQRLWSQGVRGLVSATRTPEWEGIPDYYVVPPEQKSVKIRSLSDMYGFSWDATVPIFSNKTFRQRLIQQRADKLEMGKPTRELDGQEVIGTWDGSGQTPNGEVDHIRDASVTVVDSEKISQPAPSGADSWDVPGWHIRSCQKEVLKTRPSIFMPKWAARIWLEITRVKVERLQEISEEDTINEGCQLIAKTIQHFELKPKPHFTEIERPFIHRDHFIGLWDSLNAKRGYGWDTNPWVWVIEFSILNKRG